MIVYYAGNFNNASKQYGTVATLKFNSKSQADEYTAKQDALMRTSTEPQPIVFRSKTNTTLHDVFFGESEYGDPEELFDCYVGMPSHGNKPFLTANMKVQDVPQYEHFDDEEYPESSSYLMYGDKNDAFLFHIPTKNPDFLQVITFMNTTHTKTEKSVVLKQILSNKRYFLIFFFGGNACIILKRFPFTRAYGKFCKFWIGKSLFNFSLSHKAMLELWVFFGRINSMNFNIVLGWGGEGAQVD